MNKLICWVAVSGMAVASLAYADDDSNARTVYTPDATATPLKVYVGAGLGQGRSSLGVDLSNTGDFSYSFLAGYQMSKYLAVEGSYINLGKITTTTSYSGSSTGYGAAALVFAPMSRAISVYGKFGLAHIDTAWGTSPIGGLAATQSSNGLNWGAGLRVEAIKNMDIRFGYDRYTVGSDDPLTGTVSNLSLAAILKF